MPAQTSTPVGVARWCDDFRRPALHPHCSQPCDHPAMPLMGQPSHPIPQILVLGRDTCEDTIQSRTFLTRQRIPFQYLSWEHDADTEEAIRSLNDGNIVTPTIVIGDPDNPTAVLVEPTDEELDRAIVEAGGGI